MIATVTTEPNLLDMTRERAAPEFVVEGTKAVIPIRSLLVDFFFCV